MEGLIAKESETCRACARAPTNMLTAEALRALARQAVASGLETAVPADEILPHLDSDDRNIRVAACARSRSPTGRRQSTAFCAAWTIP